MKVYKNLEQQLGIDTSQVRIIEKSLLERYNTHRVRRKLLQYQLLTRHLCQPHLVSCLWWR